MASDNRFGSKPSKLTDPNSAVGTRFDAGPYIGIIKNNVDATRCGRLQVFIPDLGGQEENPTHWRTVQYASPFFGTASRPQGLKSQDNAWDKVTHTYGMWFTPPDIDNQVLITFVMGNPSRGYWFACINPTVSHNMMPGISGSESIDKEFLSDDLREALTGGQYPTVEFNEANAELWSKRADISSIPKPIHEEQVRILLEQGLEDDLARGVISSSSQRESPSAVFGISTPGRDTGDSSDVDADTKSPYYRTGGHQFIMDDGDVDGLDQMIRLRTAGGHQIMLNDSEEIIYIANSNGSVWMEFTAEGRVHMFSDGAFSLRAKKEINLHSDTDINIHAGKNISMYAANTIKQQAKNVEINGTTEIRAFGGTVGIVSGSAINLDSATQGTWLGGSKLMFTAGKIHLNTEGEDAPAVPQLEEIPKFEFADSKKKGLKWTNNGAISSTVTTLPTHEPWLAEHNTLNTPAESDSDSVVSTPAPATESNDTNPATDMQGPMGATGAGVSEPAPMDALLTQPTTSTVIGNLTAQQLDALKAQIGNTTGANYRAVASDGKIGKYKCDAATLSSQGFTVANISNFDLATPSNWIKKNGIESQSDFLNATAIQEAVMDKKLSDLHSALVTKGTIKSDYQPAVVGGLLCVADTLGVDGAAFWFNTGSPAGTPLFNRGRYAIDVLANTPPLRNI